ncbi:MAG: hypothetical protein JST30_01240 [Armatimonadetes bacterium]|nr:hypothetical protein [Armatimonadota bacterium]
MFTRKLTAPWPVGVVLFVTATVFTVCQWRSQGTAHLFVGLLIFPGLMAVIVTGFVGTFVRRQVPIGVFIVGLAAALSTVGAGAALEPSLRSTYVLDHRRPLAPLVEEARRESERTKADFVLDDDRVRSAGAVRIRAVRRDEGSVIEIDTPHGPSLETTAVSPVPLKSGRNLQLLTKDGTGYWYLVDP